jgi:8-oxo-dGTP pyrophosphatase MutT (NUDIX family)
MARTFPTYGGTVVINSSTLGIEESVSKITESYETDEKRTALRLTPELFDDWVKAAEPVVGAPEPAPPESEPILLSPHSRRQARTHLLSNLVLVIIVALAVIYGWYRGFLVLSGTQLTITAGVIATLVLTGAVAIAALAGLIEFMTRQSVKNSWTVIRAGSLARFGHEQEFRLTNREICEVYRKRTATSTGRRFRLNQPVGRTKYTPLDGTPICFVIPPRPQRYFDVLLTPDAGLSWPGEELAHAAGGATSQREASLQPFDWEGYRRWREYTKQREYHGLLRPDTLGLRVTQLIDLPRTTGDAVLIQGAPQRYTGYLVSEQSVSLQIPGQLPYLREFFEGPAWTTRSIDLTMSGLASTRYSMFSSVSTLVTTSDGFLVLQRRSAHVQSARGGIACSSGGAIEWRDVRPNWNRSLGQFLRVSTALEGRQPVAHNSLLRSVFRELREELGLTCSDIDSDKIPAAFIGVAFNLRYGRDLNFYAHLHSHLSSTEVAQRFYRSRWSIGRYFPELLTSRKEDRWEIGHLVFVDVGNIRDDGLFSSGLEALLQDARHARGALYAFAISRRRRQVERERDELSKAAAALANSNTASGGRCPPTC